MNTLARRSAAFQGGQWPDIAVVVIHAGHAQTSALPILHRETQIVQNPKPWVRDLRKRLNDLVSLQIGWDGYAGKPVSYYVARFVEDLIGLLYVEGVPAPQLVPGSDGSLQFEWHLNQFDIEVDVLAPYEVVATLYDHVRDESEEIELEADFSDLAEWVGLLRQDRSVSNRTA